jgi:hypothetical protein
MSLIKEMSGVGTAETDSRNSINKEMFCSDTNDINHVTNEDFKFTWTN